MSEYTFKVVVVPVDPDTTQEETQELVERALGRANLAHFEVEETDE